jgi:hypothetical protein
MVEGRRGWERCHRHDDEDEDDEEEEEETVRLDFV